MRKSSGGGVESEALVPGLVVWRKPADAACDSLPSGMAGVRCRDTRVACERAIGKYVGMRGPSNGHRRRGRWPALLAGSTAVVVAALGGAANIATSLVPRTWAWTHDAAIIWGIVGVLLALAVVLAMIGARRDTGYVGDAAGGQVQGAVVVTGSGPVFIGRGRPASTSAPGTPGGSPDRAGQVVAGEIPARPAAFLEREAVAGLAAAWDAGKRV